MSAAVVGQTAINTSVPVYQLSKDTFATVVELILMFFSMLYNHIRTTRE